VTYAGDRGTRGLLISVLGVVLIPIVLLVVAAVPADGRAVAFVVGLAVIAVVAGWGGLSARGAISSGTATPVRAFAGAVLGLIVGTTAAMLCAWSLFGLVLG